MTRDTFYKSLRWIGTIVAFALLINLLSQQGWSKIAASLRQVPAWRFWVSGVLIVISRLAVAARWHVLLRSAQIEIPLKKSMGITFAGLFASNFLPTTIGGDVIRMAMVLQLGYAKAVSAASLVVDRLVGMAGMGSAAPFGLGPVLASLSFRHAAPPVALGAVPLSSRAKNFGLRATRRLWEALSVWWKRPSGLAAGFAFTWVHQLCMFGINWLFLTGMGEDISFSLVSGLWAFTYFVTLLPISINGLGLQSLSMTAIFTRFAGVSVEAAATTAILVRTFQTLASTPGVLFLPDILAGMRRGDADSLEAG